MKTVNIKGKEYVQVNERVKYFREEFEGYRLETELLSNQDGVCIFRAIVKDENGEVISTGHASENQAANFINKTNYIENCETSAVGRALGFLGIGIDVSIASSDEVANAQNRTDFQAVRAKFKEARSLEQVEMVWHAIPEKLKMFFEADYREAIKGNA